MISVAFRCSRLSLPRREGRVPLDGAGQRIHPGGNLHAHRHARHHVGVHNHHNRDVVGSAQTNLRAFWVSVMT